MPLETLLTFADIPQVQLVSLQKGERAGDIVRAGGSRIVVDLTGLIGDFASTAAALIQIDLLVSVDTINATLVYLRSAEPFYEPSGLTPARSNNRCGLERGVSSAALRRGLRTHPPEPRARDRETREVRGHSEQGGAPCPSPRLRRLAVFGSAQYCSAASMPAPLGS